MKADSELRDKLVLLFHNICILKPSYSIHIDLNLKYIYIAIFVRKENEASVEQNPYESK